MKGIVFLLAIFGACIAVGVCAQEITPTLAITEIMYDAQGSDTGKEWVEIYNYSSAPQEIITGSSQTALRFFDGSKHVLSLVAGTSTLSALGFAIIAADAELWITEHPGFAGTVFDTSMSLKNSSSTAGLTLSGDAEPFTAVAYESLWGGAGNGHTVEINDIATIPSTGPWNESTAIGGTPGYWETLVSDDGGEGDNEHDDGAGAPNDGNTGGEGSANDEENSDDNASDHTSSGNVLEMPHGGGSGSPGVSVPTPPSITIPPHTIRINELVPNPHGSDNTEWIELYHAGSVSIALGGWYMMDASKRRFTISEMTIAPGEYVIFARATTGIALNNTGSERVFLYMPNSTLHDSVSITGSALEGKSYARFEDEWHWTTKVTPRTANERGTNTVPVAIITIAKADVYYPGEVILFDAKDSHDADGDSLTFQWDFGDGASDDESSTTHTYGKSGRYTVSLTVRDGRAGEARAERTITITGTAGEDETDFSEVSDGSIIITEVMPNPKGPDTKEWLELKNMTTSTLSLLGWEVDDGEGGSKPFTFSSEHSIASLSYIIVERNVSGLAFNNDTDAVRLIASDGRLLQTVHYDGAREGFSYAFNEDDEEWAWTSEVTPAAPFIQSESVVRVLGETVIASDAPSPLAEVADDSRVTVSGVVVAPFGVMGERSLYIAPLYNHKAMLDALVEIYLEKGEPPRLLRGDRIVAGGTLRRLSRHDRILVRDVAAIAVDGAPATLTAPFIAIGDAFDATEPQWVRIAGTVARVYQKSFSLVDPLAEASAALTVTVPEGDLAEMNLAKGASIEVTGLLRRESDRVRLWLTSADDVAMSEPHIEESADTTATGTATTTAGRVPQNGTKVPWWYLASIPAAGIVGIGIKKYILPRMQ